MEAVHVLVKRYFDGSGFYICGVTTKDEVAQAFCAGGEDASAIAESYSCFIDVNVCSMGDAIKPQKWEVE